MRVFNLTDATHALVNVALQRVKVSRIADLNDPFELMSVNVRNKKLRAAFRSAKEDIHKGNGLICFSKEWSNPVLWSHYGDNHRGICLGFDVPDEMLMEVKYETDLTTFNVDPKASKGLMERQFAAQLLVKKYVDWSYEKEYRVFVGLDHSTRESGLYFSNFSDDLVLREIILGARCEVPISKIRDLVAKMPHKVHVTQGRLAFTKYRVVENRLFREKA